MFRPDAREGTVPVASVAVVGAGLGHGTCRMTSSRVRGKHGALAEFFMGSADVGGRGPRAVTGSGRRSRKRRKSLTHEKNRLPGEKRACEEERERRKDGECEARQTDARQRATARG